MSNPPRLAFPRTSTAYDTSSFRWYDFWVWVTETSKRVFIDHAFIVAGGEITKAVRNWLGNKLDASKRSQVLFMDREDIVNLYVITNLPLPNGRSSGPGNS